jgi:hypothetical protein
VFQLYREFRIYDGCAAERRLRQLLQGTCLICPIQGRNE